MSSRRSTPGAPSHPLPLPLPWYVADERRARRHAPPSILNVRPGQRVDVQVTKRTDEDYVAPPARPFQGAGQRLGAPVPAAAAAAVSSSSSRTPPAAAADAEPRAGITTRFAVDQTRPTT